MIYIFIIIALITIGLLIVIIKHPKRKWINVALAIALSLTVVLLIIFYSAYREGCRNLTTNPITFMKQWVNTEYEDTMPDQKNGKLFILYHFECPDCIQTHQDLMNELQKQNIKVYFISVQSKQGKAFLKQYPIQVVPSGVYIKQNGTPIVKPLYDMNLKPTKLDKQNLNRLFLYQKEKR